MDKRWEGKLHLQHLHRFLDYGLLSVGVVVWMERTYFFKMVSLYCRHTYFCCYWHSFGNNCTFVNPSLILLLSTNGNISRKGTTWWSIKRNILWNTPNEWWRHHSQADLSVKHHRTIKSILIDIHPTCSNKRKTFSQLYRAHHLHRVKLIGSIMFMSQSATVQR